jgi:phospholipase C
MLENRSFDHMLGYLYATSANMSPAGVSPVPGAAGPAPVTDTALASYIRANA